MNVVSKFLIKKIGLQNAKKFSKHYNNNLVLDLGCGGTHTKDRIGIDITQDADLRWDLRWGIPFDTSSVEVIRSDHLFEHLTTTELIALLKECNRVLKVGGRLDFTVPHLNPYIDAYLHNDLEFLKEKVFDVPKGEEDLYNTCFDRISWVLNRSGEHKSMFDKESIIAKVRLAGFDTVFTREYDPELDTHPRFSSVYVVAIKSK